MMAEELADLTRLIAAAGELPDNKIDGEKIASYFAALKSGKNGALQVDQTGARVSVALTLARMFAVLAGAAPALTRSLYFHFQVLEVYRTSASRTLPEAAVKRIAQGAMITSACEEACDNGTQTTVAKSGGAWRLNGTKYASENARYFDILHVKARSQAGEAIWVTLPSNRSGVFFGEQLSDEAVKSARTLIFSDVEIDESEISLEPESIATRIYLHLFRQVFNGACILGALEKALSDATQYFEGVRYQVADDSSESLARDSVDLIDAIGARCISARSIVEGCAASLDLVYEQLRTQSQSANKTLCEGLERILSGIVVVASLAQDVENAFVASGMLTNPEMGATFESRCEQIRCLLRKCFSGRQRSILTAVLTRSKESDQTCLLSLLSSQAFE